MIKKTIKLLVISSLLAGASACNSEESENHIVVYSNASTIISSVQLEENDDIIENLDSVFFSIDQTNALIFNADSLPYGTHVNKLVPQITTESASAVELQIPRVGQTDSIVDYLENSTDSVDFSNGPIKVKVTAADGTTTRVYTFKVNVHQVKSDTLIWSRAQQANLPSSFTVPQKQHTTATASAIYCLTYASGEYCMASAVNPASAWTRNKFTFSFIPRIETFTGTDDALYILAEDGTLYTSTDGLSWSPTSQRWDNIYGNYGTELWGSVNNSGTWNRVSYPTAKVQAIESTFPVSGTSQTVNFVFEMSNRPQILITGGVMASGEYSGSTWGYDGNSWVCLTSKPMPYALKDPVVVPYFISEYKVGTMRTTKRSALIAMFGERQDGKLNDTVYISRDFGVTWDKAGQQLQLSRSFPLRTEAQGFVYTETINSRGLQGYTPLWVELGTPRLPIGARFVNSVVSRSATLPASWDCPYIYIFGGIDETGNTYNTLWRGVISGFTFKPVI